MSSGSAWVSTTAGALVVSWISNGVAQVDLVIGFSSAADTASRTAANTRSAGAADAPERPTDLQYGVLLETNPDATSTTRTALSLQGLARPQAERTRPETAAKTRRRPVGTGQPYDPIYPRSGMAARRGPTVVAYLPMCGCEGL